MLDIMAFLIHAEATVKIIAAIMRAHIAALSNTAPRSVLCALTLVCATQTTVEQFVQTTLYCQRVRAAMFRVMVAAAICVPETVSAQLVLITIELMEPLQWAPSVHFSGKPYRVYPLAKFSGTITRVLHQPDGCSRAARDFLHYDLQ